MTRLELVGRTYFVRTFGCQMNLHDSERVCGLLDSCGCNMVDDPAQADIVVFMTCSVREKADTHLYGEASNLVRLPQAPSGRRLVAVGGCIAQRDGARLKERIPNVDVIFGTSALSSLPSLLVGSLSSGESGEDGALVDIEEEGRDFSCALPSRRARAFHAWVPIMTGCNNFCTFCIVPYVRGRERSRVMEPKDLSDETMAAMAEVPAVMPHLHLAVQSGSTRILRAMRRSYTREGYLDLACRLKRAVSGIALSTDIIVGFPGEEERDFEDTLSLVREVGFSFAYTFIYSRRPGTPAAKIEDTTPHEVIQERFERLARLVEEEAFASNQAELGASVEVLVEGSSKRSATVMVGHSPKNQTVLFDLPKGASPEGLVGRLCTVKVAAARPWFLRGTLEGELR